MGSWVALLGSAVALVLVMVIFWRWVNRENDKAIDKWRSTRGAMAEAANTQTVNPLPSRQAVRPAPAPDAAGRTHKLTSSGRTS